MLEKKAAETRAFCNEGKNFRSRSLRGLASDQFVDLGPSDIEQEVANERVNLVERLYNELATNDSIDAKVLRWAEHGWRRLRRGEALNMLCGKCRKS